MDREEKTVLGAIAGMTGLSSTAGTITVAVSTTKVLGITVATTTVALPVVGVALAGGALTYGGYKVWRYLRDREPPAVAGPPGQSGG